MTSAQLTSNCQSIHLEKIKTQDEHSNTIPAQLGQFNLDNGQRGTIYVLLTAQSQLVLNVLLTASTAF